MTIGRKWVLLVPAVAVAATAFLAWPYLPKRYQSTATIVVVPQRVPESYVRPTATTRIEERLSVIQQRILSRTFLERLTQQFSLYPRERRAGIMEDVVEQMRKDVEIQNGGRSASISGRSNPRVCRRSRWARRGVA